MSSLEAKRAALVLGTVMHALEDGLARADALAASDKSGDWVQGFRDGYAAAVTMARLTAPQAMACLSRYDDMSTHAREYEAFDRSEVTARSLDTARIEARMSR